MSFAILGGVVGSVSNLLLSLLREEVQLAFGVRDELEKLQGTVSTIQAVVCQADKKTIEDLVVKVWLKRLIDAAFEADDLLDNFSTEILHRGNRNEVGIFFSSSNRFVYALKMARQVKNIRSRIDAICKDKAQFQLDGNAASNPESSGLISCVRETIPCMYEPHVIGRDNEKKEIIDFLSDLNSEEDVTILAIVGIGGLGKTTLARIVFNDEDVKNSFELKLWVCVSTKSFNVEDILRKMLKQCGVDKKKIADLDMNELAIELGKQLHGKKYLLALDDVWNESLIEWLKLRGYLMKGAKGSKLLVTTRSLLVADTMKARPYKLEGLLEDKALSLLMLMAGKQESDWKNTSLEEIAKDILKKCVGVPLAIMTIGRLLISRKTEEDWSKFKDNEISKINQEEGDIMPTLRLSYDFLPSHLKRCFSYCSLFPKDYKLDPEELIRLWKAQGFIKPLSNRQAIEDVGQDYLLELLSRSFFHDAEYDTLDNLVRCKMHDLMHDLAKLVAGDDCVTMDGSRMNEFPNEARHLSVVPIEDYKWSGFERDNGRVRSLLLIVTKATQIGHLDVSCFANLRSLLLQNAGITKISRSFGRIEHLRSLDLSRNYDLRSLPNSIKKLHNLETLNLNGCWMLRRIPSGITELVNLRHLDVRGCDSLEHMPRGIGKLTNLCTLSAFVVGSEGNSKAARCKELCKLVKLRKELCIMFLDRCESISSEFGASFPIEKLALQSLEVRLRHWWNPMKEGKEGKDKEVLERLRPHRDLKRLVIIRYLGNRLSSWFSQLDKLVEIDVVGCGVTQLPQLDQLCFLKRISLTYCRSLESIELSESATDQSNLFPSLEVIVLMSLDNFWGWKRRRGGNGSNEEDDGSSWMLPRFSDKVKVFITECPRFSYSHRQKLSRLCITNKKMLEQLSRPLPEVESTPISSSGRMTMIPISAALSTVTSLALTKLKDVVLLPEPELLFRHLSSLTSLVILECDRLKALPVRTILRCLPNLEELRVDYCRELYLEDSMHDQLQQGHQMLRKIIIESIPKMETLPVWFQYLPNLQHLELRFCDGLKSLLRGSQFLSLLNSLEVLKIYCCRELDLTADGELEQLYLEDEDGDSMHNQLQHGHQMFRIIIIESIPKMETLPAWFQYLPNLQHLELRNCGSLKSLLPASQFLSLLNSLEDLWIDNCREVDLSAGDEPEKLEGIAKLQSLRLLWINKMESLPRWIQHLTSLEQLDICSCSNLKAFPEWFSNLTSLRTLCVYGANKELKRRCRRNKGEDWPKISHISFVSIIE